MALMPTARQVVDALRAEGLTVIEPPGWERRCRCCPDDKPHTHPGLGERPWGPWHGLTVHHTAGDRLTGQAAVAYCSAGGWLTTGPSSAPGPLCLSAIDGDGRVIMVGAGRANHAGACSSRAIDMMRKSSFPLDRTADVRGSDADGNAVTLGVEIMAPGPPSDVQRDAAVRWAAALCRLVGWTGGEVHGHGEISDSRDSSDPGLNMGQFRRDVMARLRTTAHTQEAYMSMSDTHGAIGERWLAMGGRNSVIGPWTGDERDSPRGGKHRPAERGFMIWHPDTGAFPSYGEIRGCYGVYGFEGGPLGYPTSDELPIRDGGRHQRFQGGNIYWSLKTGAHVVWGLMLEQYARDGWEWGKWGYPVGPERRTERGWVQDFEGGTLGVGGEQSRPKAEPRVSSGYVRPVRDPQAHPISAAYGILGSWAAGFHPGVDIACPVGTPVYATCAGNVRTRARGGWGSAYGTHVIISDDDPGGEHEDWGYCHLSKVFVSEGQHVEAGQQIGLSGNTGRTTGPHLHLECRKAGAGYAAANFRNPNRWD